jgi:hypothetical protein
MDFAGNLMKYNRPITTIDRGSTTVVQVLRSCFKLKKFILKLTLSIRSMDKRRIRNNTWQPRFEIR